MILAGNGHIGLAPDHISVLSKGQVPRQDSDLGIEGVFVSELEEVHLSKEL